MNFITYRNRIEKQMILYIKFLPYCETTEDRFKLLDEIIEIKTKIVQIDQYTMHMAANEFSSVTIQYESRGLRNNPKAA